MTKNDLEELKAWVKENCLLSNLTIERVAQEMIKVQPLEFPPDIDMTLLFKPAIVGLYDHEKVPAPISAPDCCMRL